MPSISMSPSARYVTQSGIFATKVLGPLTSKRIEQYRKMGFYGNGVVLRTMAEKKHKKQPRVAKQKSAVLRFLED